MISCSLTWWIQGLSSTCPVFKYFQVLSRMCGNPVDSGIKLTTSRSILQYTSVMPRLRTATWFTCPIPHNKNIVLLLIVLYIITRLEPITTSRLKPAFEYLHRQIHCVVAFKLFCSLYQIIWLSSHNNVNKYLYHGTTTHIFWRVP